MFEPANANPFIGASVFELSEITPRMPVVIGCGYDGTTSFRPGTRRGPDAIRAVSVVGIETYSPRQGADLEDIHFADLGNVEVPYGAPEPAAEALKSATEAILERSGIPVILGGEHSLTPGALAAVFAKYPDLLVIQFDAHADLRDEWNGNHSSHANAMRRTLDFLPADRLLQVGIRSGTRDEFMEMEKHKRLIAPTTEALKGAIVARSAESSPVYITFDLDCFDPSLLPGTGTPEPGGIFWHQFEELCQICKSLNIVGIDIVELAPNLDQSEVSAVVAAKLLREWLLVL